MNGTQQTIEEYEAARQKMLAAGNISLRDEFAGKAMQSAIIDWSTPTTDDNFKLVADFAYKMADFMLKARNA